MKLFIYFLIILFIAGCQTTNNNISYSDLKKSYQTQDKNYITPDWIKFAKEGQIELEKGKYNLASKKFNEALRHNIQNSNLQALNGLAYHMSANVKNATDFNLAEQGYSLSSKFDPSNWVPYYLNGLVNLSEKKYSLAKNNFIKAAARNVNNINVLLHLVSAAYNDLDFVLASKIIKYIQTKNLSLSHSKEVYRVCSIVFNAINDQDTFESCLSAYDKVETSQIRKNNLYKTISIWRSLNNIAEKSSNDGIIKTQETTTETTETNIESNGSLTDERMVVVDVVILGSTDDVRKTSGLNLLNGLNLQFGSTAAGTAAFTQGRSRSVDRFDSDNDESARTIVRAITVPAINYSLNIMNSADSNSKILAKPSLLALSGQESTFFSGVTINGAATSGTGESVSIEKEIGVTLSVTPQFVSDNKVLLKVAAARTFLMDPSSSVLYQFRLDTTKTTVSSNVVLNIGETLILGGLTEQQDSNLLDGVPILRDIPIIRLLFSEKESRNYKKSVTILLTPRFTENVNDKTREKANLDKVKSSDLSLLENLIGITSNKDKNELIAFNNKRELGNNYVSNKDFQVYESTSGMLKLANYLIDNIGR